MLILFYVAAVLVLALSALVVVGKLVRLEAVLLATKVLLRSTSADLVNLRTTVKELADVMQRQGEPSLLLSFEKTANPYRLFVLSNDGGSQAVNIVVSPLVIPMPTKTVRYNRWLTRDAEENGIVFANPDEDTAWKVEFDSVVNLPGNGGKVELRYHIAEGGTDLMKLEDIVEVLVRDSDADMSSIITVPIEVEFTDIDGASFPKQKYRLDYFMATNLYTLAGWA